MKAIIYKGNINIVPEPKQNGHRLWVLLKKSLDDASLPKCYTDIYAGQKVYKLPCERKNIKGLYIKSI